jgi:hypothetical protein
MPFRVLLEQLFAAPGAEVVRQTFVLACVRGLVSDSLHASRIVEPHATYRISGHDRIPPCCGRSKDFASFRCPLEGGKILAMSGSEGLCPAGAEESRTGEDESHPDGETVTPGIGVLLLEIRERRCLTMQADCFQAYIQCARANSTGTLAQDLLCTLTLIRCSNAYLSGSVGEQRVERPGEADVTGELVLESDAVLKVLEMHAAEVQAYVGRARELAPMVAAPEQDALRDNLARDLDHFVQTVIQEFQQLKG